MIDWSSSDYTNIENNLFYTSTIEGGVYINNKYDINEDLCYKCLNNTVPDNNTVPNDNAIPDNNTIPEDNAIPSDNIVSESYVNKPLNPIKLRLNTDLNYNTPVIKSNFISDIFESNSLIIFVFIILLLYMIFIELRISNMYKSFRK